MLKHNSFPSAVSLKSASIEAGLLINHAPYPTALWSLDRSFCVFNPLVSELLGYSDQEISHRPELYVDRIHPEDRNIFLSAWQNVCDGEESASCQYRFTPKHGIETRIRENSLSFRTQGSKAPAALTLYTEERKEVEKLAEAHQLHSLLRGMTHEIGNNLQAITGELELLKWSETPPPADSAAIVSSAVMQIRALTDDIEEYFFPLSGENDNSDLSSVIAKTMHESGAKIKANGIRSELSVKEPLPSVPLDGRYGKMLKAIIDFSCALLAAGGELKIEVGTCRCDGRYYIELNVISCCRDALPVEENRVFRPFINVGGYRPGLSIAVAQQVLRRQSGKIVFRKEPGNRGVFSILIPVPDRAA